MECKLGPVIVRSVVCLNCTKVAGMREMGHIETIDAKGVPNHLLSIFECQICHIMVAYTHRPVAPSIENELIEWIRDNCGHTGSHNDNHCSNCGMCPVAKTTQLRW